MLTKMARLRERASYLPPRTQSAIAWGAAIVAFVLSGVLEHALHGAARQLFWYVTVFLLGAVATLMVVGRRR